MVFVFWQINPAFLSPRNIGNMLAFTVELGLIALAMTLLMTSGEFDLSVGSLFGFCPVLMWTLYNTEATSIEVGFVLALGTAAAIGLCSGLFVTRLRIPSFLVTLGMLLVVRGSALVVTRGFPQRTWDAADLFLAELLVGDFNVGGLRVYMSLFWFVAAALLLGYLLTQTKLGNWLQAAGGNAEAARARGVAVERTKVKLFVLSAVMAGFAGIISSIRTAAANPNSGYWLRTGGHRHGRDWGDGPDGWARHYHRHGARRVHLALDAQRHCAHWRAWIGVQHFHRRDHLGHDGPAFVG